MAPRGDGGDAICGGSPTRGPSSAYTAHLMNRRSDAFFVAFSPASRLAFGYVWQREDFPWLGIWQENHSRTHAPWNGAHAGLRYGVRRVAVAGDAAPDDRPRSLFDVPDLPLDSREKPCGSRVLGGFRGRRLRARAARSARSRYPFSLAPRPDPDLRRGRPGSTRDKTRTVRRGGRRVPLSLQAHAEKT